MLKGRSSKLEKINELHLKVHHSEKGLTSNIRDKRDWNVQASKFALNTTNPIRAIVEHLNVQPNPEKSFIPLSVGKYFYY